MEGVSLVVLRVSFLRLLTTIMTFRNYFEWSITSCRSKKKDNFRYKLLQRHHVPHRLLLLQLTHSHTTHSFTLLGDSLIPFVFIRVPQSMTHTHTFSTHVVVKKQSTFSTVVCWHWYILVIIKKNTAFIVHNVLALKMLLTQIRVLKNNQNVKCKYIYNYKGYNLDYIRDYIHVLMLVLVL